MSISRTIVISCAGMGNRLGLSTTKALLEIDGKPLIFRHLEMLKDEEDIRVVVGYQAERVIDVVSKYRKDVLFVFNHDYRNTGTGASVALAAKYANEYVLSLDGDLLVHPDDMKKILACDYEFVGGNPPETDDPWMLQTYSDENGEEMVSAFSRCVGNYEWNGITQMKSVKLQNGLGHVFQLIEPYLPVRFMNIRTREIDTIGDYERAINWVKNNFE
jgi:CTP:molybdopterin cytidylyltransferase MocA